jgi:hypothetical protein
LLQSRLNPALGAIAIWATVASCGSGATDPGQTPVDPNASGPNATGGKASCDCKGGSSASGTLACGLDECGYACGTCGEGLACLGGACIAATECDYWGFSEADPEAVTPPVETALTWFSAGKELVRYQASTNDRVKKTQPPHRKILVELNASGFWGGKPAVPGTFDLVGDPNDCELCVNGYTYCNDEDQCANRYVISQGDIVLKQPAEPGGRFAGFMRGVKFKEVLADTQNGGVKDHPNGKTWCIERLEFDEPIPELNLAEGSCLKEGTGREVGSNIADFTLQNCNGDWVDLHSRCGKYDVVWLVATAGW